MLRELIDMLHIVLLDLIWAFRPLDRMIGKLLPAITGRTRRAEMNSLKANNELTLRILVLNNNVCNKENVHG